MDVMCRNRMGCVGHGWDGMCRDMMGWVGMQCAEMGCVEWDGMG
jgi:hypothetical protein